MDVLIKLITSLSMIILQLVCKWFLSMKQFRVIKPEIRVLGVDDGAFVPHSRGFAPIIGVVFRGGYWLDGVVSTKVEIDGFDATDKLSSMIIRSAHYRQLRVIMLDGITFAGFNVVDIKGLNAETGLPVIVVTRDRPNFDDVHSALKNLPESEKRWEALLNAGQIFEVNTKTKTKKVYIEISGISEDDAQKIVKLTSTRSSVPEPLRVAHLIASGLSNL
jgi:endonuclease V-like protein UPF0215 family